MSSPKNCLIKQKLSVLFVCPIFFTFFRATPWRTFMFLDFLNIFRVRLVPCPNVHFFGIFGAFTLGFLILKLGTFFILIVTFKNKKTWCYGFFCNCVLCITVDSSGRGGGVTSVIVISMSIIFNKMIST